MWNILKADKCHKHHKIQKKNPIYFHELTAWHTSIITFISYIFIAYTLFFSSYDNFLIFSINRMEGNSIVPLVWLTEICFFVNKFRIFLQLYNLLLLMSCKVWQLLSNLENTYPFKKSVFSQFSFRYKLFFHRLILALYISKLISLTFTSTSVAKHFRTCYYPEMTSGSVASGPWFTQHSGWQDDFVEVIWYWGG